MRMIFGGASSQPVPWQHPAARDRAGSWERCRDVYEGRDAVKAREERYLPQLSSHHADYQSYLQRAPFYAAFARTVDGLAGCVMRRPPKIEVSTRLLSELSDVDRNGLPLSALAEIGLRELLIAGRVGISQDVVHGEVRWTLHEAEDILTWRTSTNMDGDAVLSHVITRESVFVPDEKEPRQMAEQMVLREWVLTGEGAVARTINEKGETQSEAPLLLGSGEPLDRLPFWIADLPGGQKPGVQHLPAKPPLLDLADLSLSHYRTAADLEHALHWVALPTPCVATADKPDTGEFVIGSSHAWWLGKEGSAMMLEVSGAGLEALEKALSRKQGQMAAIGARLVAEPTRAAETAEAVRLKSGGDHSLLHTIVDTLERALGHGLETHAHWAGTPAGKDPRVRLNRDFIDARLSAPDAQALMQMLQESAISHESFLEAMHRGEWIDLPPEEELARIEKEEEAKPDPPVAPPVMMPPQPPGMMPAQEETDAETPA